MPLTPAKSLKVVASHQADAAPRDRWLFVTPLFLFLCLMSIAIGIALWQRSAQRGQTQFETDVLATQLAHGVESQLASTLAELTALRDRFQAEPERIDRDFAFLGRGLTTRNGKIRALKWVDPDGTFRQVLPGREATMPLDKSITADPLWEAGWKNVLLHVEDSLATYRFSQTDTFLRCILPTRGNPAGGATALGGALVARVAIDGIVRDALAPWHNDYSFRLIDDELVVFGSTAGAPLVSPATAPSGASTRPAAAQAYVLAGGKGSAVNVDPHRPPAPHAPKIAAEFMSTRPVKVLDRVWRLEVIPSPVAINRASSKAFWQIIAAGLGLATVISLTLWQFVLSRYRQDRRHRRYLAALERLNDIATAIGARLDSPHEMLDMLAMAARDLTAMERSGVGLIDRGTAVLRVVAVAGDVPSATPRQFELSSLPLCSQVLSLRQPVFIADVRKGNYELNARVAETFGARSLVLLPLVTGDRRLGLLALCSSTPRVFADDDRRVARLLASKAAVILSNSDLYNRMAEALRSQQTLFEQREAIFAVNAAVYRAPTLDESLQMIAELAPGVLGVDLCLLTLSSGDSEDRARLAAVTKPHGASLIGKNFTRRGTNGEVVQATRRTLVIEDARTHPGVHPTIRAHLDVGSVVYMPLLRTGGSFMGLLVLIRHKAGPFAPEQLNLAELFTVRAAAAIENVELLDQSRRDAQAKTMLLRELNHRVKNNLASIITLLSLDEPEMSPRARQWLGRAIDRIRTMARTHDLFSGGMDRVSLEDLIEQTIPSLSVVRPPTVKVTTDVRAAVTLRTDRAVSLAMVLHELCYNAIIHGLGSSHGSVIIRARLEHQPVEGKTPASKVVLEVIDDGTATHPPASDSGGVMLARPAVETTQRVGAGGLGLILVQGLVSRELNGQFNLHTTVDGTVARVVFPVSAEDFTK